MRYRASLARLVLLLPVSFTLAGCFVVPVKMRTLQQNVAGQRILVPPTADVVPGLTTWQDLQLKYKDMAIDSGDPDLFFAQYRTSGWALVYGFATNDTASVDGGRLWEEMDILATFNNEGLVKTFDQIPEGQLGPRLMEMQKQLILSPMNFSTPIRLSGEKSGRPDRPVRIDLAASAMAIEVGRRAKENQSPPPAATATITAPQIAKMKVEAAVDWTVDDFSTRPLTVELKFVAQTPVGRKLNVDLEPREAFALVRWLAQQGPPLEVSTALKR